MKLPVSRSKDEDPEDHINEQYIGLSKIFEHRTRLAICALLSRYERIAFSRFKHLLKETDGNLGAQLRKLEEAGYVTAQKEFSDRRPVTWYAITEEGSEALETHLASLSALLGQD